MIVAWIGYAMLYAVGVGASAACVERLLARRHYARRLLWMAAMTSSALLPAARSWNAPPLAARTVVTRSFATPAVEPHATYHARLNLDAVALTAWAAMTLFAATWLAVSNARLHRALARCDRTRIDGDDVIVSAEFGPAVVGIVRPRIVLPAWVLSAAESDRRIVLAHEREHLRARDTFWQLAGLALAVAMPWNAALWWQLKRLRLAIEMDCDSRVVGRHRLDPIRYGELLIRAHTSASSTMGSALALVQGRSSLGQRIDALVGLPRRSATRVAEAMLGSLAFAGAVAFVPAPAIRTASPVVLRTATARDTMARTPVGVAVAASVPSALRAGASANTRPRRVVPAHAVPPVATIPSASKQAAMLASPSVAPLPLRPFGRGVLVSRGVAGFARAGGIDTIAARGGAVLARAIRRDSAGGGAFAVAPRADSAVPRPAGAGAGAKPPR
jgi:beta-lactamase regulating signal transducer with metallopeptidase domain